MKHTVLFKFDRKNDCLVITRIDHTTGNDVLHLYDEGVMRNALFSVKIDGHPIVRIAVKLMRGDSIELEMTSSEWEDLEFLVN